MSSQTNSSIQQLRALAGQADAQAKLAITLLSPRQPRDVLMAALDALRRHPMAEAREPLLALYAHIAASPEKRDPAGYLRRPLLDALRPVATPADLALLLAAVTTYERYPPDFQEEAGLVRAAGLIALSEVDEQLARYHAVRLLADLYHTDLMSGQPAMSAVNVLSAQGDTEALYLYAMLPDSARVGEVTAECLRSLVGVPATLLPPLLAHYADATDPVVLIGLFDLLLGHEEGVQGEEFIAGFLAQTDAVDMYRYLATTLVASGRPPLIALLIEAVRWETDPQKREAAHEALLLRADDPEIAEVVARLAPA
jgi:hypothetical protein